MIYGSFAITMWGTAAKFYRNLLLTLFDETQALRATPRPVRVGYIKGTSTQAKILGIFGVPLMVGVNH